VIAVRLTLQILRPQNTLHYKNITTAGSDMVLLKKQIIGICWGNEAWNMFFLAM